MSGLEKIKNNNLYPFRKMLYEKKKHINLDLLKYYQLFQNTNQREQPASHLSPCYRGTWEGGRERERGVSGAPRKINDILGTANLRTRFIQFSVGWTSLPHQHTHAHASPPRPTLTYNHNFYLGNTTLIQSRTTILLGQQCCCNHYIRTTTLL